MGGSLLLVVINFMFFVLYTDSSNSAVEYDYYCILYS